MRGQVVKLDRGYPLVRCEDGGLVRCEHATSLVKEDYSSRAVIGDVVEISIPEGHDKGIIESIAPRSCQLVRKDPSERALPQVLAANFDRILLAQALPKVNLKRLERELVLAHETGAELSIVLTKADLVSDPQEVRKIEEQVRAIAGEVEVFVVSVEDAKSIQRIGELIFAGSLAVLMGSSGVGKSSLINKLLGEDVLEVGSVREGDSKGRHTTVSREIVQLPGGGRIVDMPGVRGLGLWDAQAGIEAAFPDVEEIAASCRFRDCKHLDEPGCAVQKALENGDLQRERFESYQALHKEAKEVRQCREEARQARGEKASTRRRARKANKVSKNKKR